MPVIRFSEAAIARLVPPRAGRVDYWDKGQPGFGLRLSKSGARTWQVMYRSSGRRKRLALGAWPGLSLKHARDAAAEAMKQVAGGDDPSRQRSRVTGGQVNVAYLAGSYLERHAQRHKKSWRADAGMIRRTLLPAWGKRSADGIARRDVIELVEQLAARGQGHSANRHLALVRKMFAWGCEVDLVQSNPATGVSAPYREVARERVLSDKEIGMVWAAWTKQGWPYGPLFKLLLLTGQTRSDIAAMQLADIQFQSRVWTPPGARGNGSHTHELPLADLALEILASLPRSPGGLVFPSAPRSTKPVSGFSNAVRKSHMLSGVDGWQVRDLRRTAAIGMVRLGAQPEILDRILNVGAHKASGVRGIYQLAADVEDKRAVLAAWAERVSSLAGR